MQVVPQWLLPSLHSPQVSPMAASQPPEQTTNPSASPSVQGTPTVTVRRLGDSAYHQNDTT